jgi:hypothetical protein
MSSDNPPDLTIAGISPVAERGLARQCAEPARYRCSVPGVFRLAGGRCRARIWAIPAAGQGADRARSGRSQSRRRTRLRRMGAGVEAIARWRRRGQVQAASTIDERGLWLRMNLNASISTARPSSPSSVICALRWRWILKRRVGSSLPSPRAIGRPTRTSRSLPATPAREAGGELANGPVTAGVRSRTTGAC